MDVSYSSTDELPEVISLFNEFWGPKRSADTWKVLYGGSPMGDTVSIVLRDESLGIIGHIGAITCKYNYGKKEILGSLLIDLVIKKSLIGKGLGKVLLKETHKILEQKFDFSYGFTNKLVMKSHVATGMTDLGKAPVFIRWPQFIGRKNIRISEDQDIHRLGNNRIRTSPRSDNEERELMVRGEKLVPIGIFGDQFAGFCSDSGLLFSSKDSSALNWRYFHLPYSKFYAIGLERMGVLQGYIVFSNRSVKGKDIGFIIDVWTNQDDIYTAKVLIRAAISRLSILGAKYINCLLVGNNWYVEALKECQFLQVPGALNRNLNICFKAYDSNLVNLASSLNDWIMFWGDTDLL